jgi:hypothetical protein
VYDNDSLTFAWPSKKKGTENKIDDKVVMCVKAISVNDNDFHQPSSKESESTAVCVIR